MATRISALASLVVALTAAPAWATCSLSTAGVAFGTYDVFNNAPVESTGTVSLRCSHEKNILVTLGRGTSGSFNRTLASGSERLSYNLYLDAARTVIWGDGAAGTGRYQNAKPPDNQWVNVTVYGRIAAGQDVAIGAYSDGIVATIIF